MADLSVYQNQLPSVGTVAAQYAAETHSAAELTTVTSPGGRTELSATYDTVNDRVATLTDANGGHLDLRRRRCRARRRPPTTARCMGSSPEDFWPLNDTAGPLARDVVGSAATAAIPRPPATYSNVTLGAAGPTGFADGTAASFNGTNSQVSIPGGYFARHRRGVGGSCGSRPPGPGRCCRPPPGRPAASRWRLWIASGAEPAWRGRSAARTLNARAFRHLHVGTRSTTASGIRRCSPSAPAPQIRSGHLQPDRDLVPGRRALATAHDHHAGHRVRHRLHRRHRQRARTAILNGSIADVSLYTSQLTVRPGRRALRRAAEPGRGPDRRQRPVRAAADVTTPTLNTQTITVTDPVGKNTVYTVRQRGAGAGRPTCSAG